MLVRRTFEYSYYEDTGTFGFRPVWMHRADPTREVSHDMLEHRIAPSLNAAEDEFQALGALLALRIETGAFNSLLSQEELLSRLIRANLDDMREADLDEPRPVATRRLNSDFAYTEQILQEAVADAFDSLSGSATGSALSNSQTCRQAVLSHLRIGYRHAYRRFKDTDLYTLAAVTFKILNKLSVGLIESQELTLGDRVCFSVQTRSGRISYTVNNRSTIIF